MKLKKRSLILMLALLLSIQGMMLCSCAKTPQRYTVQSFAYFDTVTTVMGYAPTKVEFDRIAGDVFTELSCYHKLFTIYDQYEGLENLYTINETVGGAHRTVTVDERIIEMLLFAKEMHALTDGRVNIAMGSVLSLWHQYREAGKADPDNAALPPTERLSAASVHTDIANLVIDAERCTVTLTDPEMTLDVGAIAKGYAVELVARMLESRGITGYLINVGGNVRAVGTKPDGQGFLAGIEAPDSDAYLATLIVQDGALVTSGSYQRYYTVNGKQYHHIIDPETQMPAARYTSVSVVCGDSGVADALSTALFCMPLDEGRALVESLDGVEALWVTAEGAQYTSSTWPKT